MQHPARTARGTLAVGLSSGGDGQAWITPHLIADWISYDATLYISTTVHVPPAGATSTHLLRILACVLLGSADRSALAIWLPAMDAAKHCRKPIIIT